MIDASRDSTAAPEGRTVGPGPGEIVEAFLDHARALDLDAAAELLDDDCRYENVPFHVARGRQRILRDLGLFMRPVEAFEIDVRHIAVQGEAVLTERIDTFVVRGHRIAIPLMGVFVVRAGRIVEWRDYFDWSLTTGRILRGALGWPLRALRANRPILARRAPEGDSGPPER